MLFGLSVYKLGYMKAKVQNKGGKNQWYTVTTLVFTFNTKQNNII
jgi:hypothetical protein